MLTVVIQKTNLSVYLSELKQTLKLNKDEKSNFKFNFDACPFLLICIL